jgi:required for meiotic nuclear division protein 1
MTAETQIAPLRDSKPDQRQTASVRAFLLGSRLDTRMFESEGAIATTTPTLRVDGGTAFLFRYGVAVLVDAAPDAERELLADLRPRVLDPLETAEMDQAVISVQADKEDQVSPAGTIILREASSERLQLVATALSKSVVLAHYEARIAGVFDRIEPLADQLQRKGRIGWGTRELLQQIGYVLKTQQFMVGRVGVEEKPEVLWDHPELERLYVRLEDEYELRERSHVIEQKLALIHDTVGSLLELVQNKLSLRLEWYVLVLILIEIALSAYEVAHRT